MCHSCDAVIALFPEARHFDEGVRFPLCIRSGRKKHGAMPAARTNDVALIDADT
jgi:hypothetical protein